MFLVAQQEIVSEVCVAEERRKDTFAFSFEWVFDVIDMFQLSWLCALYSSSRASIVNSRSDLARGRRALSGF